MCFHLVWLDLGFGYREEVDSEVPSKSELLFFPPNNLNSFCSHSPHDLARRHSHCKNLLENIASLVLVFPGYTITTGILV